MMDIHETASLITLKSDFVPMLKVRMKATRVCFAIPPVPARRLAWSVTLQ